MDEVKLTVSQVAATLGESVNVIRNWFRDFKAYIPHDKSGGGYNLFTQDSMRVFISIQKMTREQNLTTRQVEAILSGAAAPTIREDEPDGPSLREEIAELKQMMQLQTEFNAALIQKLDEQRAQLERIVDRRDSELLLTLREMRQNRQKPWWKRLLKE